MMKNQLKMIIATTLLVSVSGLSAEEADSSMSGMNHAGDDMKKMNKADSKPKDTMSGMQHSRKNMSGSKDKSDMKGMKMGAGNEMAEMSMQGGEAPADARSPDYSEGFGFGKIQRPVLADEHNFASMIVDRFETVNSDENTYITYDLQAWYGRDYDRAVLKAEGDYDNGQLLEASTELLWSHSVATYWDTQVGIRYDSSKEVSDQTWLAFGIQGLAPYWFELDATGYVGDSGRLAFTLEAEYELLLTQKLILQPRFEMSLYSKDDIDRRVGSGLSDASLGIRLRYEFQREIAPYIGVEWAGKYGTTKDFARADGEDSNETRLVAGIRFWF